MSLCSQTIPNNKCFHSLSSWKWNGNKGKIESKSDYEPWK